MGVSGTSDFDSMVAAADATCARAVEPILDGLSPAERCAIHHRHLAAVFGFPRVDVDVAYDRALEAVQRGLTCGGASKPCVEALECVERTQNGAVGVQPPRETGRELRGLQEAVIAVSLDARHGTGGPK